ncbi:hypothetical protein UNSWDHB_2470 [Dehalobacter sp. UNSWDHB]|nr:hypothetical protein UNSWDHB_2470 [Dehalobacter sp. UNSWDHB]
MSKNLLGQRKIKRHQNNWPDNGMETDNIFANKMNIGRPVSFVFFAVRIAQRRDIVDQGIEPDIDHMFRIKRDLDAPLEGRTRYTEIFKPAFNKPDHFISSRSRLNKIGMVLNILQQSATVFGHPEKVTFFFQKFHISSTIRIRTFSVNKFVLCPESFTRCTVPTFVFGFVNIALFIKPCKYLLYDFGMPFFCCPDKIIIGNVKQSPEFLKFIDDSVNICKRIHPGIFSSPYNFLRILIRPGQKIDIIALHSSQTGHRIRSNSRVRSPDMRTGIGIINRCGNIIFHRNRPPRIIDLVPPHESKKLMERGVFK